MKRNRVGSQSRVIDNINSRVTLTSSPIFSLAYRRACCPFSTKDWKSRKICPVPETAVIKSLPLTTSSEASYPSTAPHLNPCLTRWPKLENVRSQLLKEQQQDKLWRAQAKTKVERLRKEMSASPGPQTEQAFTGAESGSPHTCQRYHLGFGGWMHCNHRLWLADDRYWPTYRISLSYQTVHLGDARVSPRCFRFVGLFSTLPSHIGSFLL